MLHKLALFKLLESFVARLKRDGCTLHALATFRFRYHLSDPIKARTKCYTKEALESLLKFIAENGEVPIVENSPLYAELANIPRIDPGELQLLVAGIHDQSAIIYTNDKRFLEALHGDKRLGNHRQTVAGRIVVFEQVLQGLLGQLSFADFKTRITPAVEHDTMVRAILGSGEAATLESVEEAIAAYVADAQERFAPLLAVSWPIPRP